MPTPKQEPRALADGVEVRDARLEEAEELLSLMRGYCDFYEASPPDQGLLAAADQHRPALARRPAASGGDHGGDAPGR